MNVPATLNRSLIAIYFTEDFFTIIQPYLTDLPDITLEDLNADPVMLMIPPCDDETADEEIQAIEASIVEAILALFLDEDQTPPELTQGFATYFDIEFFEDVYDLASDYELDYEDEDEDDTDEFQGELPADGGFSEPTLN